jgi:2,3-bisphosphoglycerate-independent phosphoglycerate mutase
MDMALIRSLIQPATTRIVLLLIDGLGGLPLTPGGLTTLEAAHTPHLDDLATRSICGLHQPVGAGITAGSGPSHLALFGYDPIQYQVGRGILSAVGIGFELTPQDVVARGNLCTLDEEGRIADRRAGRLSTERNRELCALLREIQLPGVELSVETVADYRLLLVLRGEGLSSDLADTDPQAMGRTPLEPRALSSEAEGTAQLVREFLTRARQMLADHHPANMLLLRGFSNLPHWPSMQEVFGLRALAIAAYSEYLGVARLVGMRDVQTVDSVERELGVLASCWDDFDYFYVHIKGTDSAGEDGDFDRKMAVIEGVDAHIPTLLDLEPDVLIVTGDHSTPARLKAHSWHPAPVLLWSAYCRPDDVDRFSERACVSGGLGPRIPSLDLMPLALANAGRLAKFGA